LQIGGSLTTAIENKILEHTQEYYSVLPYDFGVKKPPGIDHILRVKERVKQMDLLGDIYLMEQCLLKAAVSYECYKLTFYCFSMI
jgi:hypothetical protein